MENFEGNNVIDTQDKVVDFSKMTREDLIKYYKDVVRQNREEFPEMFMEEKKDKEISLLENTYNIFKKIFKYEFVVILGVFIGAFVCTQSYKYKAIKEVSDDTIALQVEYLQSDDIFSK